MKKTQATILIIDDQEEILIALKLLLKRSFETVLTCSDPKKIRDILLVTDIDLVLMDMNFRRGYEDGKEGIFWLKEIKNLKPTAHIILMTSFGNVETAVEGLKLGAIDYILKPWNNEELILLVKDTVKQHRKTNKQQQNNKLTTMFAGTSAAIEKVYKVTNRIAKTDATVLILGENGTGKSVLAQQIHLNSTRKEAPFISVDLGSLNENLFESELFGYAKGAFTDAKQDTVGKFEAADGGTIFLDEIGNVPLHLQGKLLQAIQNKEIVRVGENKVRAIDIRIITATNMDLEEAAKQGVFRQDLFYRINTIAITMPSLRERKDDIKPLTAYFLTYFAEKYDLEVPEITAGVLEQLQNYEWRGNIRELQNRIERAVILAENNQISIENLGFDAVIAKTDTENIHSLNDMERQKIVERLHFYKGNISKTAEDLGISRAALYRKMEKHNILNQ